MLELEGPLQKIRVKVPRTHYCSVADIYREPSQISRILDTEQVFIHPVEHHAFKPFEVDLSSDYIEKNLRDIFYKSAGVNLNSIPTIVMERIKNGIPYRDGGIYPHEFRCYFMLKDGGVSQSDLS